MITGVMPGQSGPVAGMARIRVIQAIPAEQLGWLLRAAALGGSRYRDSDSGTGSGAEPRRLTISGRGRRWL
jgi:hypothetical protein